MGPTGSPPAAPTRRVFGLTASGTDKGLVAGQQSALAEGRHLDVLNFFEAWEWRRPLPATQLKAIADRGAVPEITWEPWDPRAGVDQPKYSLAAVADGSFDPYLASWAAAARAYAQPLLIRLAHEANGTWYPWSTTRNGGSPAAYVAAFRHVHDVFLAQGALNVSWVWSPNAGPRATDGYPGDAYVDIIGVDGYNGGADVTYMGGWRTPDQVFSTTLAALDALSPAKPVWVNETASSERGGSKPAWIQELVAYLRGTRVKGLLWFDLNKETDWRLASSPAAVAAARRALSRW